MTFIQIFLNLFLGSWLGIMLGISALTAPIVFKELPREMAGELMGKIFAQYYHIGYILLGLALILLIAKGLLFKPFPYIKLTLIGLSLGCLFYAGTEIQPKAHLMKTMMRTMEDDIQKEEKKLEFAKLHKESVQLNMVVLICSLVAFIAVNVPCYSGCVSKASAPQELEQPANKQ